MSNRYFSELRLNEHASRTWAWALMAAIFCAVVLSVACSGGGGSSPPPPPTFTVSGNVLASAGNVIDSDVNDTSTIPVINNEFDTAQTVSTPAVVGGYVNVAGSGPVGNSMTAGDANDFFQVFLANGQSVRLSLPVTAAADIELYLWDSARVW